MADSNEHNQLGQPIGPALPSWTPARAPAIANLQGRWCALERLERQRHGPDLFRAQALDERGAMWTYLPYGPFESERASADWVDAMASDPLLQVLAIIDRSLQSAVGTAAYMRMDAPMGCIEIGHLAFSPLLQRSCAATEAMYLMMELVFRNGFRRLEWKCDTLNAPSRRAALRLGFIFEGVFRQATITKRRNRDTAWYSVIDGEWPRLQLAFQRWLDPANFDDQGRQRLALSQLTIGGLGQA